MKLFIIYIVYLVILYSIGAIRSKKKARQHKELERISGWKEYMHKLEYLGTVQQLQNNCTEAGLPCYVSKDTHSLGSIFVFTHPLARDYANYIVHRYITAGVLFTIKEVPEDVELTKDGIITWCVMNEE